MIELIDFDRDGLALEDGGALFERCLGIETRSLGDILAHHQLDHEPVEHLGDGEHLLAARRRPRQRDGRGLGHLGAAGDDCVHRSHPGDLHALDGESVLRPQAEIVGEIAQNKGEAVGRHRHGDVLEGRLRRNGRAQDAQHAKRQPDRAADPHRSCPFIRPRAMMRLAPGHRKRRGRGA